MNQKEKISKKVLKEIANSLYDKIVNGEYKNVNIEFKNIIDSNMPGGIGVKGARIIVKLYY